MLCEDCQVLVQEADKVIFCGETSETIKREVSTQVFQRSVEEKCYLCNRLFIMLGSEKWRQIINELLARNLISFDKSVDCDVPHLIHMRLGCKLIPIVQRGDEGSADVFGTAYSYGYLLVSLLPVRQSLPLLSDAALAAKDTTSTSDKRVLNLILHWLDDCTSSKEHTYCPSILEQPQMYPTRLIDVSPDLDSGDYWRLVEVTNSILGHYITLSHRWGTGTVKLNRYTAANMMKGVPVADLPHTYQDAIKVTRHLKVKYLWIDSICIFQDERLDIPREAIKMAEVFGNALCNLSALTGTDDGLFCSRSPQIMNSEAPFLRHNTHSLNQSYFINDLQLWRGELFHMPLSARGWILQEEVLAARTVYFGARQVLWNCMEARACETYPTMQFRDAYPPKEGGFQFPNHLRANELFLTDEELKPITSAVRSFRSRYLAPIPEQEENDRSGLKPSPWRDHLFFVWTSFISHYSLRHLTFPHDKLLAIAGITQLFSKIFRTRSVAGLFESHFLEGLLWYVRANTITHRPSHRAPSWSWAACEGYIVYAEGFHVSWTVARVVRVPGEEFLGDESVESGNDSMRLQAYCLNFRVKGKGKWTAYREHHAVPHLLVRLDTDEDVSHLKEIYGAVIRTSAYRLTDNMDSSDLSGSASASKLVSPTQTPLKPKGKILIAAQGIILTPIAIPTSTISSSTTSNSTPISSSSTISTSTSTPNPPTCNPPTDANPKICETRYRRVGFFAFEDRKSGSLTPKWVDPGFKIFPPPLSADMRRDGCGKRKVASEFDFDAQEGCMRFWEVV